MNGKLKQIGLSEENGRRKSRGSQSHQLWEQARRLDREFRKRVKAKPIAASPQWQAEVREIGAEIKDEEIGQFRFKL